MRSDGLLAFAAEKRARYEQLKDLLEYPEIQADKAYYLCLFEEFLFLRPVVEALSSYEDAEASLLALSELFPTLSAAEREAFSKEKQEYFDQKTLARSKLSALLSGESGVIERVRGRILLGADDGQEAQYLFSSVETLIRSRGYRLLSVYSRYSRKGLRPRGFDFLIEGADAYATIYPFLGAYDVKASAEKVVLRFAAYLQEDPVVFSDKDFAIDLFHSSGAGGQNINKVETAVRVTHLPTGIAASCQDERSQLKNKERALQTVKERVRQFYDDERRKKEDEIDEFLFSPQRGLRRVIGDRELTFSGKLSATYPFPLSAKDAEDWVEKFRLYE